MSLINIEKFIYVKYNKIEKLIKPIKLIAGLFNKMRLFILFVAALNGINHFLKFLPESNYVSGLIAILFALKELVDYISQKYKEPNFLEYIEIYKKSFYLWLIRAGIALTKTKSP